MENTKWKEQIWIASDIVEDFETEKEIRKASGEKGLRCPDPECQNPILIYRHGEKRSAHFAHLISKHCDYTDFDKGNSSIIKDVIKTIYLHLKNKGYKVYPEVKILDHHYTHLLIDAPEGQKIAIEIGTKQMSANKMDHIVDAYREKGLAVKWIVVDYTDQIIQENQTYHIKRYQLNKSKNKDLMVVNRNRSEIAQYKEDPHQYEYKGLPMEVEDYPKMFHYIAPIDDLTIEDGELTIVGFKKKYENYISEKQSAFEKKIREKKEYYKSRKQVLARNRHPANPIRDNQFKSLKNKQTNVVHDMHIRPNGTSRCNDEILRLLEQQEDEVVYHGERWLKCEKCGFVGILKDDFKWFYGQKGQINLGRRKYCK